MKAPIKETPLSPSERAIARRIEHVRLTRDAFPIADPDLAELMELLHRMQMCQAKEPFQWMAGDAIRKLRAYISKQSNR